MFPSYFHYTLGVLTVGFTLDSFVAVPPAVLGLLDALAVALAARGAWVALEGLLFPASVEEGAVR